MLIILHWVLLYIKGLFKKIINIHETKMRNKRKKVCEGKKKLYVFCRAFQTLAHHTLSCVSAEHTCELCAATASWEPATSEL